MGTKRLKRQRREMAEAAARLLGPATTIVTKGVPLKPGTPEHRQAMEKIASMLSEQEYQSLLASRGRAGGSGGRLNRRRPRPT